MSTDQPTTTATPRTANEMLCCIAQLIQGWKGTTPANEWSEFDEQCLCDCAALGRELAAAADSHAETVRLLEAMLNVADNCDETGYADGVGFVDIDKLHNEIRAHLATLKGEKK